MKTNHSIYAGSLCFVMLSIAHAGGQGQPAPQMPATTPASSPAAQPSVLATGLDAGTLLTKEEVAAVQGCAVTNVQSSASKGGQFRVLQSIYNAVEANKSVSLAVTQTDPSAATKRSAREFWHETFDRFTESEDDDEKEKEKEREAAKKGKTAASAQEREKEEEERRNRPRRIDGVGEAAFWTGNPVGGALYVLRGETFIRISVGGPDKQEAKLNKSKTLAKKILGRL